MLKSDKMPRHANGADKLKKLSDFSELCSYHRQQFMRAVSCPDLTQSRIIGDLLKITEDTYIGHVAGLGNISTLQDLQSALPVSSYEALKPMITKIIDGAPDILFRGRPQSFLKTSGITGKPKLIPQTAHWYENYRGPSRYAQWGMYANFNPDMLAAPGRVLDLTWERLSPDEFIGGLPCHAITQRPESLGGNDWHPPWYDSPWFDFRQGNLSWAERLYTKLRYFAGTPLDTIVCVNPSTIAASLTILKENKEGSRLLMF